MNSIFINGTTVVLDGMELDSYSILQQCDFAKVDIPRFCYHDQLSIAGNCRICVVELSNSVKPVISCATEITNNMEIYTNSLLVKQARESVLEFLLLNHPLDCPICDQGGECDLQDISLVYGSDMSRFSYDKRVVSDKNFGPLVKSIMTRCIHCTRCVRFFDEVIGNSLVGTLGRGSSSEIGTFAYDSNRSGQPQPFYNTEIIGNVIDLCPVGALTSKPYSFTSRPWELISTESIDIFDSLCSNIRIDSRGSELIRILPRLNSLVNNEWITDKVRFCYEGLKNDRIVTPLLNSNFFIPDVNLYSSTINKSVEYSYNSSHNVLHLSSWDQAFAYFRHSFLCWLNTSLNSYHMYFFSGHLIDSTAFFFFRFFCNVFCISNINIHVDFDVDLRLNYLVSDSLSSLFNDCNVFLFVGINFKLESPILNIRIKNNSFSNESAVRIGYLGTNISLNYPFLHLGLSSVYLLHFFYGHSFFSFDIHKVVCVCGSSSSFHLNNLFHQISMSLFSTNYVSLYSGDLNLFDLCVLSSYNYRTNFTLNYNCNFLFLLGADFLSHLYDTNTFIVYVGHTFEAFSYNRLPDIVLPSCSFVEKEGYYVNCQGKVQITGHAISAGDSSWTYELIMFSLIKYICLDYVLYSSSFTFFYDGYILSYDFYLSLFSKYFPFLLNSVSDNHTCVFLLSLVPNSFFFFFNIFIILFRHYYDSDVVSRRTSYFHLCSDFSKSEYNNYL